MRQKAALLRPFEHAPSAGDLTNLHRRFPRTLPLTLPVRAGYTPERPERTVPTLATSPNPLSEDPSLSGDRTQYSRRATRRDPHSGPIRPRARPTGLKRYAPHETRATDGRFGHRPKTFCRGGKCSI
jgi:hypothetical protein